MNLLVLHILAMVGGIALLALICLLGWAVWQVANNDELRGIWREK